MILQDFYNIFKYRYEKSHDVLVSKAGEYAHRGDRLSNFKKAAALQSCTPERALWGMVSKHLVALSDFVDRLDAGEDIPESQWEEKIGDSINYLILLDALLQERRSAESISSYPPREDMEENDVTT
jgi:hypothetical protein